MGINRRTTSIFLKEFASRILFLRFLQGSLILSLSMKKGRCTHGAKEHFISSVMEIKPMLKPLRKYKDLPIKKWFMFLVLEAKRMLTVWLQLQTEPCIHGVRDIKES